MSYYNNYPINRKSKAKSQELLHAISYERSKERTDSCNGFHSSDLKTRIGKIQLSVPRHRNQPFKTMIFDNYARSESALIAGMAEMVVNGVSTRKVTRVVETICGESISKSSVSDLCKDLEKEVDEFRNRPLEGRYPFLTVDATYFKVRENQMFNCETIEAVRKKRDQILEDYQEHAETAMTCLDEGFESFMTAWYYLRVSAAYRTSNHIAREQEALLATGIKP